MPSVGCFPQDVCIGYSEMFIRLDAIRCPENNFILVGEAFRKVWLARMLEQRRLVINSDARWTRHWQFMPVDLRDAIYLHDLGFRPFIALKETAEEIGFKVNQASLMRLRSLFTVV